MLRSFPKIFLLSRTWNYTKVSKPLTKTFPLKINCNNAFLRLATIPTANHRSPFEQYTAVLALSILGWLGFVDEDEKKESELIMTLKRSVLATQREQYDKAEQLLHIALRLAQQQQNQQGVVYCYDLMANVAFNRMELNKAEKLFVSVLQMLLATGTKQDDLKVCLYKLVY